MEAILVRSIGKMQMVVSADQHALVADEPPEAGDGLGFTPYQLLLAALGT